MKLILFHFCPWRHMCTSRLRISLCLLQNLSAERTAMAWTFILLMPFTYKILRKFSTISTFKPSLLQTVNIHTIFKGDYNNINIHYSYKKAKRKSNVNWIPSFPRPGDLPTAVKNKIKSSFQLHESHQRDWEMSKQSISASPDSDAKATCPTCWVVENAWMA